MRIFKTRWIARFARRSKIADELLVEAIRRAERGLIDADLGGGVIKQRVGREGQGRSGGYRTLIAFRAGDRAFFVFAFAKNDRDNISNEELASLRQVADQWLRRNESEIPKRCVMAGSRRSKMENRPKKLSRLTRALIETAEDMREGGLLDEGVYEQIIHRHLPDELRSIEIPIPTGEDIKAMREKANLSQAVFARKLHLSTGYVSQLERGIRRPSGPTLVLLDLIRKRGIEAIQ